MKYTINVEKKTIGIFPLIYVTVFDLYDTLDKLKKIYPDLDNWKITFLTEKEQEDIGLSGLTMPSIIPGT